MYNNPVNFVDPTGHYGRQTTRDNGGAGGTDEEIVQDLIRLEQAVGGEFSTVVAAHELGISRDVVEKVAYGTLDDDVAKFIMLRGDVIGNAHAMIAAGWDPATVRSSPTYQMVMSQEYPIGALDFVDVSIGSMQLAVGGFNLYRGVRSAPTYPAGFTNATGSYIRKLNVNNEALLAELRNTLPGQWQKVYQDGWLNGEQVSLHYFQHESGMVFDVKVKGNWSNPGSR